MNIRLIYTPGTPADARIDELKRRLEERRLEVELVDADSREGAALTEDYDLPQRPAVIVSDSTGSPLQTWQGELPTVEDISYYATQ